MPIVSNSINYATPSYSGISTESYTDTLKYFSLHQNVLDGSYKVLGSSTPLWSAALSDSAGVFSSPIVVTVDYTAWIHSLHLKGDAAQDVYPTEFTYTIYNNTTVLFTQTFTNSNVEWKHNLSQSYNATSYKVSISKINRANYTARLTSVFNPHELCRSDTVSVGVTNVANISSLAYVLGVDTIRVKTTEARSFTNTVNAASTNIINITDSSSFTNNVNGINNAPVILSSNVAVQNSFISSDNLPVVITGDGTIKNTTVVPDILRVKTTEARSFTNNISSTDTLHLDKYLIEQTLTNVHTKMKEDSRVIYGKAMISYMSPLLDNNFINTANTTAHNTSADQILDGTKDSYDKLFLLSENVLDGSYTVIGPNTKAGWWSQVESNASGTFAIDPVISLDFSPRLIQSLSVCSSVLHGIVLVDYTVNVLSNGTVQTYNIVGNYKYEYMVSASSIPEASNVTITIHKINRAYSPANISEVSISSTVWYNQEDLISIDFLEELSYADEVEALGGVSANEITVSIRNDDKQFYFNNEKAILSKQLKKNRRLVAYLGTEIIPGTIEWYLLGTFWSYRWDVPVGELYAKVQAFDTLGLLNTFKYLNRQVLVDTSIGDAIDVVLTDAKTRYFAELTWSVDAALYNITIHYVWFGDGSYMQALNQLTQNYRFNIYCDRSGNIVARLRTEIIDFYDVWSDSTNMVSKTYPTLYTDVPNTIRVDVTNVAVISAHVINVSSPFSAPATLSFNSTKPIVGNEVITIDADATVSYTYERYSWGITFIFAGSGTVRSLVVTADALDVTKGINITVANQQAVQTNGEILKTITGDFIQSVSYASDLANIILADVNTDVYDADVNYTGDIALSINDPIVVKDTITPTDKYRIKRHSLYWDGSLTGTAKINT